MPASLTRGEDQAQSKDQSHGYLHVVGSGLGRRMGCWRPKGSSQSCCLLLGDTSGDMATKHKSMSLPQVDLTESCSIFINDVLFWPWSASILHRRHGYPTCQGQTSKLESAIKTYFFARITSKERKFEETKRACDIMWPRSIWLSTLEPGNNQNMTPNTNRGDFSSESDICQGELLYLDNLSLT